MSIVIQNVGGDLLGESEYELRINQEVIVRFKHNRPEGLAVCLRKAAEAAERAEWQKAEGLLHAFGRVGLLGGKDRPTNSKTGA